MVFPDGVCHLNEEEMAWWTHVMDAATASVMELPFARCAVMAAESVQPVPWVHAISILGEV